MVYKVIGLMSGSSLDGLDIAYVHLQESVTTLKDTPRKWEFTILHSACYPYSEQWRQDLASARELPALEYQLLHIRYGHYLGEQVGRFVEEHNLHYQVQLIASHGHTTFHVPEQQMTAQLGDGAALAASTKINVVSDLRAMDLALGGQGAPIVPVGERLLLQGHQFFLNLGGIANISAHTAGRFVAFDVCPANRVLNGLAALAGADYDEDGRLAAAGEVEEGLLGRLNTLPYYAKPYPKSLANEFGTETVFPLMREAVEGMEGEGIDQSAEGGISVQDALRTYVEHIALQIQQSVKGLVSDQVQRDGKAPGSDQVPGSDQAPGFGEAPGAGQVPEGGGTYKMLVTGGGAHNGFLVGRLQALLAPLRVEVVVPDKQLVDYKEALVMALIGVLRWREENNVFASVTGASRDSIGGAVWIGQEA
jgi:anhydro-N-acetylmuramic acid kinase